MRADTMICSVLSAILLAACVKAPTPPVNSPAFVRRAPLPGQPGYLETIRYIYSGMRYVTSDAAFFISSGGEMCFQGLPDPTMNPYAVRKNYWCISPLAVGAVDRIRNGVTNVNGVRLWCRITAPQCVHKFGWPNPMDELWEANSVLAETTPSRGQKAAFEHLIYLMGGNLGQAAVPAWGGTPALLDPPG
jgi:hypothetical protein